MFLEQVQEGRHRARRIIPGQKNFLVRGTIFGPRILGKCMAFPVISTSKRTRRPLERSAGRFDANRQPATKHIATADFEEFVLPCYWTMCFGSRRRFCLAPASADGRAVAGGVSLAALAGGHFGMPPPELENGLGQYRPYDQLVYTPLGKSAFEGNVLQNSC
jgi:hypothetical protein